MRFRAVLGGGGGTSTRIGEDEEEEAVRQGGEIEEEEEAGLRRLEEIIMEVVDGEGVGKGVQEDQVWEEREELRW